MTSVRRNYPTIWCMIFFVVQYLNIINRLHF